LRRGVRNGTLFLCSKPAGLGWHQNSDRHVAWLTSQTNCGAPDVPEDRWTGVVKIFLKKYIKYLAGIEICFIFGM